MSTSVKDNMSEEFYEIKSKEILEKIYKSFGKENMYNYDLLEAYDEVEKEFERTKKGIGVSKFSELYKKANNLLPQ